MHPATTSAKPMKSLLEQSKLQTVDLSSNSLRNIEPKTFIHNPSLETLSLSSNHDLRLPVDGPFLYSHSLRVLKLSNCILSYLPPEAFQKLPVPHQEIYILHKKFEVLNPVQSVGRLTLLDISHNCVTDLQSDIFTAVPQLIRLS